MTIKYRFNVNTLKEFEKFSLIFFKLQSISIRAICSNRQQKIVFGNKIRPLFVGVY